MSALVILECNACGAITPPWPTADRAREEAGPDGWAVAVDYCNFDGSNVDYCPTCTGPAQVEGFMPTHPTVGITRPGTVSRLDAARRGVEQLSKALVAIGADLVTRLPELTPTHALVWLAIARADRLAEELAA